MISYKRKMLNQQNKLLKEIDSLLSNYSFSPYYNNAEEYLFITLPDIDMLLEEYNISCSHTLENSFFRILSEERLASFWLGYCVAKKIPFNTEIDYLKLIKECRKFEQEKENE